MSILMIFFFTNLECAEKWMKKYFDARCVFSVQLHRQILPVCICLSSLSLLLLQILIYLDNKLLGKKVAKFLHHLNTIIIILIAINNKMIIWNRCGAEAKSLGQFMIAIFLITIIIINSSLSPTTK